MVSTLKNTEIEIESLIDIDILEMLEKWIRGGTCHAIDWYAQKNNNKWKTITKTKNHHIQYIGMNTIYWMGNASKITCW